MYLFVNRNFLYADRKFVFMEFGFLENAHFREIELSDSIYIEFAKSKGKEIILHSEYDIE